MKAVLFDFDGLILDTETPEYHAWREIYARHGHELALETWAAAVGTLNGFDPVQELRERTGGEIREEVIDRVIAWAQATLNAQPLRPGVEALWAEADRAGIHRAIVSSSDRAWVGSNLARFGATGGWAAVICAEGVPERAKPSPLMYEEALEVLGVEAAEALVLEDSPNGIAAARAAGIRVVAVPNPVTSELDLSDADLVIESLEGLTLADLA